MWLMRRFWNETWKILDSVQKRTGCKIIMALKGFAMFSVFPMIRHYLQGIAASSLDEARLGCEEFGKEVHVCAPAYQESEFNELLNYSNHIVFNSFSQWNRFKPSLRVQKKEVSAAAFASIRSIPKSKSPFMTPADLFPGWASRGRTFKPDNLEGITGLHFHNLCELNADSLARTLAGVRRKIRRVSEGDAMGELRRRTSHHAKGL